MTTRRPFLVATVLLLTAGWACAWAVVSDRAERELCEARNQALREEIEANRRFIARRAALETLEADLDSVEPAYSRILPVRELATNEKLLRDIQVMSEAAGIRIVSISIVEVKP